MLQKQALNKGYKPVLVSSLTPKGGTSEKPLVIKQSTQNTFNSIQFFYQKISLLKWNRQLENMG